MSPQLLPEEIALPHSALSEDGFLFVWLFCLLVSSMALWSLSTCFYPFLPLSHCLGLFARALSLSLSVVEDRVSSYSPGWPETHCAAQHGLRPIMI